MTISLTSHKWTKERIIRAYREISIAPSSRPYVGKNSTAVPGSDLIPRLLGQSTPPASRARDPGRPAPPTSSLLFLSFPFPLLPLFPRRKACRKHPTTIPAFHFAPPSPPAESCAPIVETKHVFKSLTWSMGKISTCISPIL